MKLLRLRLRQAPLSVTVTGPSPLPPDADPRCQATTAKGARCKLDAEPGTDRCVIHLPEPPVRHA